MDRKDTLTLDLLPEDCLVYIFSKIGELKTQIQVSKVSAGFQYLCLRIWRNAYKCLCLEEWKKLQLTNDDLQYFVKIMASIVQEVRLIAYSLHDFVIELRESFQIDCLPNVIRFEIDNVLDAYVDDSDVYTLAQLIPKVQVLSLAPALSGRHLKLFDNLEKLYLYHGDEKIYEIKNEYLSEIFENLSNLRVLDIRSFEQSKLNLFSIDECQKLEVLKLNLNVLKPVLDKVLSLPRLRTLTVLLDQVFDVSLIVNVDSYGYKIYEMNEFYYILKQKSKQITGIAVDNYFLPLTSSWDDALEILELKKLKKFAFCNYEFNDDMLIKYVVMKELRFLCCRNWLKLTNETLLKLINACTKLEYLDISYCRLINKDFLDGALLALKNQGKRKPQLTIYYAMSGIGDDIEKHPAYSSWITLMNFSLDFPPDSDSGLSYVQRGYEFNFE